MSLEAQLTPGEHGMTSCCDTESYVTSVGAWGSTTTVSPEGTVHVTLPWASAIRGTGWAAGSDSLGCATCPPTWVDWAAACFVDLAAADVTVASELVIQRAAGAMCWLSAVVAGRESAGWRDSRFAALAGLPIDAASRRRCVVQAVMTFVAPAGWRSAG